MMISTSFSLASLIKDLSKCKLSFLDSSLSLESPIIFEQNLANRVEFLLIGNFQPKHVINQQHCVLFPQSLIKIFINKIRVQINQFTRNKHPVHFLLNPVIIVQRFPQFLELATRNIIIKMLGASFPNLQIIPVKFIQPAVNLSFQRSIPLNLGFDHRLIMLEIILSEVRADFFNMRHIVTFEQREDVSSATFEFLSQTL